MKIEIDIFDVIIPLIMEDSNIKGETLQERVQWIWNELLKRLGKIER